MPLLGDGNFAAKGGVSDTKEANPGKPTDKPEGKPRKANPDTQTKGKPRHTDKPEKGKPRHTDFFPKANPEANPKVQKQTQTHRLLPRSKPRKQTQTHRLPDFFRLPLGRHACDGSIGRNSCTRNTTSTRGSQPDASTVTPSRHRSSQTAPTASRHFECKDGILLQEYFLRIILLTDVRRLGACW